MLCTTHTAQTCGGSWLKRNTGNEYLIQARPRHKSGKVRCKSPGLAVMVFMGNSRLQARRRVAASILLRCLFLRVFFYRRLFPFRS